MSSEHRAIFLRNDNTDIVYDGDWTPVQANTVANFGNFGPAYSPTLQSTKSSSSFSLSFHGSSIFVFGTVNIANESTNPNPTWECSVDGISLGKPNLFSSPENNWSLCSSSDIPDGAHELVVNVTSDGMPFYLDYIEYRSSPDVSLENTLIMIDNSDSAIDFISGWGALGGGANQTTDPDGLANVTFVGVQLSWYGFIPVEESHNASSGEYSIDGGPFASFQLAGLPQGVKTTIYNQLFFITPNLNMGTHVLSVKYTGSTGQTPLTLDYLIVLNGSFPSSSTSPNSGGSATYTSTSFPTSSITPSPVSGRKSSLNVGAIVGGVVGSIVGVAILVFLVWLCYRKRSREPQHEIVPFLHQPTPIPPPQTRQISKNSTQPMEHNSDPVNPTSLYTGTLSSNSLRNTLTAVASVPNGSDPRPLSVTHAYIDPRVLLQLEDSGLRLIHRPAVEEVGNPPIYTEQ